MANSQIPKRGSLVGVDVSITDYAEVTDCVIDAARNGRSLTVGACAVHTLMEAHRDPLFAAVLNSFDIVTPDGQPLRWGLRWTGQAALRDRVNAAYSLNFSSDDHFYARIASRDFFERLANMASRKTTGFTWSVGSTSR